jgi:CheY-like chemotaxis protein
VAVAEAPREGDKEEVLHFALAILDHLRALTREGGLAGAVVVGRPYQLIELRKRFGDREDLRMILAPVKPSDFLDAARRLARAKGAGGEKEGGEGEGGEAVADGIDAAHRAALVAEREAEPGWMFDSVSSAGGERDEGSGSGSGASFGGENENEKGGSGGGSGSVATVHDSDLDLSGMRVLLVEDNALNQQMATFSIVKRGASLDVASHGGEAVDLVRKSFERRRASLEGDPRGSEAAPPPLPYDCVLMDMMMPVMDGAEATKRIRALETEFAVRGAAATRMPIVGLSANVGPEYTARVKAAGMDGTLSKPFYPATLRSTLASVKKGEYQGFEGTTIA